MVLEIMADIGRYENKGGTTTKISDRPLHPQLAGCLREMRRRTGSGGTGRENGDISLYCRVCYPKRLDELLLSLKRRSENKRGSKKGAHKKKKKLCQRGVGRNRILPRLPSALDNCFKTVQGEKTQ